jgi:hypothetical protein
MESIVVDESCMESYPCQHDVKFPDGSYRCMNGVEIYELYVQYGVTPPPHFFDYKDFNINNHI